MENHAAVEPVMTLPQSLTPTAAVTNGTLKKVGTHMEKKEGSLLFFYTCGYHDSYYLISDSLEWHRGSWR